MALGTPLSTLKTLLKAEVGNDLSVVTAMDTAFMQLFILGQRDLADRFDWPHLKYRADVAVSANAQYSALPSINFERPCRVSTRDNGTSDMWTPVGYGIDDAEYNLYDYADGDTSTPISKWQRYEATWTGQSGSAGQFEVWPVPDKAQVVRFSGQRRVADFTSDPSIAYLDDLLLVYWVAATYLTRIKSAQAPLAVAKYNERMSQLRRCSPRRSGFTVVGGGGRIYRRRVINTADETESAETIPFFGSGSQTFGSSEKVFGNS